MTGISIGSGIAPTDGVNSGFFGIGSDGLAAAATTTAWTPASLFAASEAGVWYNPSDLSSLCQTYDGTAGNVAVGDPVGRMEDLSGNDKHALQSVSASRPILRKDASNRYYLEFDGVGTNLSAASVTLASMTGLTTFQTISPGTTLGRPWMVGDGVSDGNVTWLLSSQANGDYCTISLGGSVRAYPGWSSALVFPNLDPAIFTSLHDYSSNPSVTARKNGVSLGAPTSNNGDGPQAVGTWQDGRALYVGSSATPNQFSDFKLYGMLFRGVVSGAEDIALVEAWYNTLFGVY